MSAPCMMLFPACVSLTPRLCSCFASTFEARLGGGGGSRRVCRRRKDRLGWWMHVKGLAGRQHMRQTAGSGWR